VLLDGEANEDDILLAARITARYSKGHTADQVIVQVTGLDGVSRELVVAPLPPDELKPVWHL
jgi:hypothetical protein